MVIGTEQQIKIPGRCIILRSFVNISWLNFIPTCMKHFSFLTHELNQRKAGVCCGGKHWKSQTLPYPLEVIIRRCLCRQIKRLLGSDTRHGNYSRALSDKLVCMFIQSYCVKFACDYDEARDKTDNFSSQTLLELMCFNPS